MPDRLEFAIDIPPISPAALSVDGLADAGRERDPPRHRPGEQGGRIDVRANGWPRRGARQRGRHRRGLRETATPGTGLANLRERLRVFYGGEARSSWPRMRRTACWRRSRSMRQP
jgi:hypothetical protein